MQAATPLCPYPTSQPHSFHEAGGMDVGELRAYKLGKKRWSYNQVELDIRENGGQGRRVVMKQAVHMAAPSGTNASEAGVDFELLLANEETLLMSCFLVHDEPEGRMVEGIHKYFWPLVDRCQCRRGCNGPVLRPIQRFGKMGKNAARSPSPDPTDRTNGNMKDTRYIYLSFDEAGTHVGGTKTCFRLVAAFFDPATSECLSTAMSSRVRVLANNDVPGGAAQLTLAVSLPSLWPGWATVASPRLLSFEQQFAAAGLLSPGLLGYVPSLAALPQGQGEGPSTSHWSSDADTVPLEGPSDAASPSPHSTRRRTAAAAAAAAVWDGNSAATQASPLFRTVNKPEDGHAPAGRPERLPGSVHSGNSEHESPAKRTRRTPYGAYFMIANADGARSEAYLNATDFPGMDASKNKLEFAQLGPVVEEQFGNQYLPPTAALRDCHQGEAVTTLRDFLGEISVEEQQILQACANEMLAPGGQSAGPVLELDRDQPEDIRLRYMSAERKGPLDAVLITPGSPLSAPSALNTSFPYGPAGELHGALLGSGEVNAELLLGFNLFANEEGLKYNDDGTCECISSPCGGLVVAQ